jgi:hypothetical protein
MKAATKNEYVQVVEKARLLLKENTEWRDRYAGYANSICRTTRLIEIVRRSFRQWSPLYVYLNTTSAKNVRNSVSFELRYMGQTIAELKGNKEKVHRLNTTRYDQINERDFGCKIRLAGADWRGEDAARFRRFFKDRQGPRAVTVGKGNEEHCLQSLLLTEFSKNKSREKPLVGIQPVTIAKVRFPMPTPISASNPTAIKYSGTRGGGIDILARTGFGGRATHLCIIELKINSGKSESKAAMKQAIAYATFIRELLRNDAGAAWWRLFGFSGELPNKLELYAACAMPSNERNETSFGRTELRIDGDTIRLHYLYFHLVDDCKKIRIRPGGTTLKIV